MKTPTLTPRPYGAKQLLDNLSPPTKTGQKAKTNVSRTCIYCGCTDKLSCLGGCSWIEIHTHAPTGICSRCADTVNRRRRMDIGHFVLIQPGITPGKIWMENRIGEGRDVPIDRLEANLEKFFKKEF